MENITYHPFDWEEMRNHRIEYNKINKYDFRARDLSFEIDSELLCAILDLQCGLEEFVTHDIKLCYRYIEKIRKKGKYIKNDFDCDDTATQVLKIYGENYEQYYIAWLDGSDTKIYEKCLVKGLEYEYVDKIKSKSFPRKIAEKKQVNLCVRLGLFDLAKEKIKRYRNVSDAEITEDTIYKWFDFYTIFIKYINGDGSVTREEMNELFLKIFSEHAKGNKKVFFEYGGIIGMYDVYYTYYKHFLNLPDSELTASNVLQSCRKGLLHWKNAERVD